MQAFQRRRTNAPISFRISHPYSGRSHFGPLRRILRRWGSDFSGRPANRAIRHLDRFLQRQRSNDHPHEPRVRARRVAGSRFDRLLAHGFSDDGHARAPWERVNHGSGKPAGRTGRDPHRPDADRIPAQSGVPECFRSTAFFRPRRPRFWRPIGIPDPRMGVVRCVPDRSLRSPWLR